MRWAASMAAARQLVRHRHILVDGKVVDIKSYKVNVGEKVSLSPAAREFKCVQEAMKSGKEIPAYIKADGPFEAEITRIPTFTECPSHKVLHPKSIVNLMM